MAKFIRKTEFNAYQFVPGQVTNEYGEGSIDDIVEAAFPNAEIKSVSITPERLDMFREKQPASLTIKFYDFDSYDADSTVAGEAETYVLRPGEWMYEARNGGYEVVSDEEFRKMGFESA